MPCVDSNSVESEEEEGFGTVVQAQVPRAPNLASVESTTAPLLLGDEPGDFSHESFTSTCSAELIIEAVIEAGGDRGEWTSDELPRKVSRIASNEQMIQVS